MLARVRRHDALMLYLQACPRLLLADGAAEHCLPRRLQLRFLCACACHTAITLRWSSFQLVG